MGTSEWLNKAFYLGSSWGQLVKIALGVPMTAPAANFHPSVLPLATGRPRLYVSPKTCTSATGHSSWLALRLSQSICK